MSKKITKNTISSTKIRKQQFSNKAKDKNIFQDKSDLDIAKKVKPKRGISKSKKNNLAHSNLKTNFQSKKTDQEKKDLTNIESLINKNTSNDMTVNNNKSFKNSLLIPTFLTLIYLELFFKISIFGLKSIFQINSLMLFLLLLTVSSLIAILGNITKYPKINKIIYFTCLGIITIFFNVALIFKKVFNTYFCFSLFGLADQAVAFTDTAISEIFQNVFLIVGLFLPFIFLFLSKQKLNFNFLNKKNGSLNFLCLFLSLPLEEIIIYQTKDQDNSLYNLFNKTYNNALNIEKIGVLPAFYLDLKELIFHYDEQNNIDIPILSEQDNDTSEDYKQDQPELSSKYTYNNLDIDFSSLINNEKNKTLLNMHKYFNESEGTFKNEYTGLFKDKNLIVIMAESLNTIGIREDVTPTLYKFATTGFNFTNFYTPVNLSTIGGEFQNLTGLFANLNDLNKYFRKGTNYFPFGLGTVFNNLGYDVKAYHANDAYFQDRNIYLQNMGFSYFKAKNTGLEKLMDCNSWPASDEEMINVTTNEWLNSSKFLTYYVSVSSHMPYSKNGNAIVSKNWSLVSNLNYSDEAKGYLASVIELDKAVASLLKSLEEAGKLDDTVIAIIPDHYPYSMSINSINELSDYKRDNTIEVNHNSLIIWNSKTPSTVIDKTSSQLDFLPTVYNLFGIDYDSRLFMGKDILSSEPGLAYFQNKSWVSDYGTYYASNGKFVAKDGKDIPENYVENINKVVANRINMSKLIIENDYYRKIYPNK